eukprot:Seg2710.2 transcript_id=Seg2710.2/GoldUCD/mRNA.D3Y31 product="hypothetical protein" protein_id=Seg2710.2/GoldUCD/D3Y31
MRNLYLEEEQMKPQIETAGRQRPPDPLCEFIIAIYFAAAHPELGKLSHSLDIWHKAKKLSKNLHAAAKDKDATSLKPWIDSVVNHFWYSCELAKGDVAKLKDSWFGVVHHVCNEHEWAESQCKHGPLTELEPKTYLSKNSKALEKLRSVVFDPKFISNLSYNTKFRHTGNVENFNSMLTKYAPKRNAFDYRYFIGRMALAAIDHNMHAHRAIAKTKDGRSCYKRCYNKSTRKYHAQPVKECKEYNYIPYCLAKIITARQQLDSVSGRVVRSKRDPRFISPNLDLANKAPPTEQLIEERFSRMEKKCM